MIESLKAALSLHGSQPTVLVMRSGAKGKTILQRRRRQPHSTSRKARPDAAEEIPNDDISNEA
ncbi:hypothetical protein BJF93_04700 [Xaviernesmea oryzae]|uniref:Uncharacterized protein n=1 Tax=Xaviernesmea oryzae TaxID=464029 RepID=A0A1Q9AUT1_9HYPH|nr:hypothetical protein BJF93_04700 [Xaviernesmea oryzae]